MDADSNVESNENQMEDEDILNELVDKKKKKPKEKIGFRERKVNFTIVIII